MNYKEILESVNNGDINALKAFIELKQINDELIDVLEQIKKIAIDEAMKYPEKTFTAFGAQIEKRSTPSTWNYLENNALLSAKERVKYIEKLAQMGGGVLPDTGEEIPKAIKIEGKQTIAVKILK